MNNKQDLRSHYRALRASVPDHLREEYARSMATHFSAEKKWAGCSSIAGYLATQGEADIGFLVEFLFNERKKILLPRMIENKSLIFIPWSKDEKLREGKFGILEPADGMPEAPELILVPLLAFDAKGQRLGYGGGYYDRTLEQPLYKESLRVGVGFALQRHEALPHGPHDVRLHAMLTEEGVTWF